LVPVEIPVLRDWFSLQPRPSAPNTLDYDMKWASFREFRDPVIPYDEWAPNNREVSELVTGGVIDSSEKKEITLDLRKYGLGYDYPLGAFGRSLGSYLHRYL